MPVNASQDFRTRPVRQLPCLYAIPFSYHPIYIVGARISASGIANSALLLPGQYTTSTNPQLLHSLLTSSSASLNPSPGFQDSSSVSLPLNVALQPGLAVYPQPLYAGQAAFARLPSTPPTNASQPLSAGSIAISSNVWASVTAGSNNRVILWDSIPDIAQLPTSSAGSLSLLGIESAACSPPCAGSGVCSASGSCSCAPGFTGTACESCARGFFGPSCQQCPAGCGSCDDGISGSGRCLTATVGNPPSSCNCLNGICNANGQCTCNPGFTTADNGTACAKCLPGFFLTSTGDCKGPSSVFSLFGYVLWLISVYVQYAIWVARSARMVTAPASLARQDSPRTRTIGPSVSPLHLSPRAARFVPMVASATALSVWHVRLCVERALARPRMTALSVGLAGSLQAETVSRRMGMASASVRN